MKIKTTLKTNTGLFNVPYPPSPLTEKREKGMILDNFWKLFRIKREKELKIGGDGGAAGGAATSSHSCGCGVAAAGWS